MVQLEPSHIYSSAYREVSEAWNVESITAITSILVPRLTSGETTGISAREDILAEARVSDVFFSVSRARYDGLPVRKLLPFIASRHVFVYAYMLANFTFHQNFH